jgi:hypothetical protein
MKELLRIYVLWHPESAVGQAAADAISKHFDGLGMERDGVAYRVPVRFRSEAWDRASGSEAPRGVRWEDAEHNAIVLLHDELTARDEDTWDAYVQTVRQEMRARRKVDIYIPFQCAENVQALSSDGMTQYARQYRWAAKLPDDEARTKRLLLHILQRVRTHLRQLSGQAERLEPLFVSHAKADGDETAWGVVEHINNKDQDALVRAGARIVYGGNLDRAGFTFKIFRHLAEAYAVRGRKPPFVHIVPEPVLRKADFDDFSAILKEGRGIVETKVALADESTITLKPQEREGKAGVLAAPGSGGAIKIEAQEALQALLGPRASKPSEAFSAARRVMAKLTVGRVVMGGKMGLKERLDDQYEGAMPGIMEETLITLDSGQALLTLGAFGGAARDVAIALKLLDPSMRVPRGKQEESYSSALEQIGIRAQRIPGQLRGDLSHIAKEDRAEPLSFAIVRALDKWQEEAPSPTIGTQDRL